jgi:hypothetical protein
MSKTGGKISLIDAVGRESLVENRLLRMLFSGQRGSHAYARRQNDASRARQQALVAVARAQHLPAAAPARAAHPHST